MSLGPVSSNKDSHQAPVPLLLCCFTFSGQPTPGLLVSTTPITLPTSIGVLPSGFYDGRVAQQDIEAFQHRSQLGVDKPAKVTIHLYDADHSLWSALVQTTAGVPIYGFRGATLQMALVMWAPGTTSFTSDAPVMFQGTCDQEVPGPGWETLVITANTSHDTATIKLPMFPIQNRCPKIFPSTAAQRLAAAFDSTSPYWPCGYSADIAGGCGNQTTPNLPDPNNPGGFLTDASGNYIVCDYLRSDPTRTDLTTGCMARLGNYASIIDAPAPDGNIWQDAAGHPTGRFAGIEWSPTGYYTIGQNYISSQKQQDFSFANSAVWGQYHNLLYGTQWVVPKIANVVETGNDTKCKAMICTGNVAMVANIGPYSGQVITGGVQQVVENGINVSRTPSGGDNIWWDYCNYGDRGSPLLEGDTGYRTNTYFNLDDPYGSIATIEVSVYSEVFTGNGVPSLQVLCSGPQVMAFLPLATVSANGTTATFTFVDSVSPEYAYVYFALNYYAPPTVNVIGTTLAGVNQLYAGLTGSNWSGGPPGVVTTPSTVTGSGTGGYAGALSQYASTNPAWVLLDMLFKANWTLPEINIGTFFQCGAFCDVGISYVDNTGNTATHNRFLCMFSLETRRSAASLIAAVLKCFNGYTYWDQAGLLCLGINQTLADSQPAPITGSNYYNTAIPSFAATDPTTPVNGYVAYLFDESTICSTGEGDKTRLDIQAEDNATIMTPNQIYIQFQDMDNGYVVDSLGEIDANAVTRAGGALQAGGSLIPETLDVTGISNFDQAVRIANVYLAERQYGNLANDPRGTCVYTFTTTVRAEHLRTGHLVALTLKSFGYNKQLFRVIKRSDSTNSQQIKLTVQFHNDIWYADEYGQQPQAFYSNAGVSSPDRAPLPWQPYAEQPQSPTPTVFTLTQVSVAGGNATYYYSGYTGPAPYAGMPVAVSNFLTAGNNVGALIASTGSGTFVVAATTQVNETDAATATGGCAFPSTEWSFQLAEIDGTNADGTPNIQLQVSGDLPVNQPNGTAPPPIVPTQNTSTTSGSIPAGNYLACICSLDAGGNYSIPSSIISCTLNAVGGIVIGNLGWLGGAVGYDIFIGRTHYSMTHQASNPASTPSSITISSLPNVRTYGPPDITAGSVEVQWKEVIHGGIIGEGVVFTSASPNTVTIGGPGSGTLASMAGRTLLLIGRPNLEANLPIISFSIISSSGSPAPVLVVDRDPTSLLYAGDVVVICAQANIASAATIGDTGFINAYAPGGVAATDVGCVVRIIEGTGAGQFRTITAVSGSGGNTTYTVSLQWNTIPDSTSLFIVEEEGWRNPSADIPINAATYTNTLAGAMDVSNYASTAVLVQPMIYDYSGTKSSSLFRSPVRMIWLSGAQGTRLLTS